MDVEGVELIHGDVLDVLPRLVEEIQAGERLPFQMVVTSPPYWGLRDYGLEPSVWDGEPGCEHVWGEERLVSTGRNDQDRDTRHTDGRNPATQGLVGCPKQQTSTGSFCSLCGAWRGCLGLEPTPDCGRPMLDLRDDLTEPEQAYVMSELRKAGLLDIDREPSEGRR